MQRGCCHGLLAFALVVGGLAAAPAAGQAQDDYEVPRTPWGDPDLQGLWDTRTYTRRWNGRRSSATASS